MNKDEKFDFVFFWKQNDTGLYDRRQDMLVKYLSQSEKVNQIIHFDAPLSIKSLIKRLKFSKTDQSMRIFWQSIKRVLGLSHQGNIRNYTYLFSSLLPRYSGFFGLPWGSRDGFKEFVRKILAKHGVTPGRMIFYAFPIHFDFPSLVSDLKPNFVVADIVDDQRSFTISDDNLRAKYTRNYEEIIQISDLVVTNCIGAKLAMHELSAQITVIPNACEIPEINVFPKRPRKLKGIDGPIIGYVGNLSLRIDLELLEKMARHSNKWTIVLIGSATERSEILELKKYRNVRFLGVIPYKKVGAYLDYFDVGIVPHLVNEMTQSMNSLKIFTYCSRGIPVVSTEIENVAELASMVQFANSHDDFIAKIDTILSDPPQGTRPNANQHALLTAHTWERRVLTLLDLIDQRWQR